MSRIAKNPITIPNGVEATIVGASIVIKGAKGMLSTEIASEVFVKRVDDCLVFEYDRNNRLSNSLAGTTRAVLANMVYGVSKGFERKLNLVGVGYRATAKDQTLSLSLGFSHPVEFSVPEGITVETPTQTEIVIKGTDKQRVGQVAADIRAYRPPEPYKGKGVRYSDEVIIRKEAKKK
jgi:large subunit ribosomal protein L6